MIARAAAAVAAANKAIRALIILAHVICADETPIRVGPGPKTRKRYLLVACTRLLTCYFLGDRSLATFGAFVFPDLAGVVVVHDRYQNYDAFPGIIHQLCTAHLLRDLADAAETYPDAIWPGQIADALRGLIHAANQARDKGLAAIPGDIAAPLIHDLPPRRAGRAVRDPPPPRPQAAPLPRPARMPPPPARRRAALRQRPAHPANIKTTPNVICAQPKRSRKSPAGSAPKKPPASGTRSAATCPPPPRTASTSWTPCVMPSPALPGCHPSPTPRKLRSPVTSRHPALPSRTGLNAYGCTATIRRCGRPVSV